MSFPNDRTYSFDANLQLSDNAAAYTASGDMQVGGASGIIDLGGNTATNPVQNARIDAIAIFDVTAIDVASGSETYQIDILGSNDPGFATGVQCLAGIQLGKGSALRNTSSQDSVIGRYELGFTNQAGGNLFEYIKAVLTAGGTTPSISISAFVAVLPEP